MYPQVVLCKESIHIEISNYSPSSLYTELHRDNGCYHFTDEHTSSITPSRIFKASIVDSHNLIPELVTQATESIEFVQGNEGAGSIKQINFAKGGGFGLVKYHID
ncbi:major allergen Pru ar 1-like [Olea europaea subsp. europaea]|uniref:Major allergen Pru ar 1-like n=1 Tax=Olea europaea subsp. europaea TaxID=158383 RepID=A0A8S0SJP4_OLEEU|nr:major allergen Pru ar 1-like [Olea europaea subsp. europaea]